MTPARRYTYLKGQKLEVFHCGTHTCPVCSKNVEKPAKNMQEILKKRSKLKTVRNSVSDDCINVKRQK